MDAGIRITRGRDEDGSADLGTTTPRDADRSSAQVVRVTPIEFGSCTYHEAAIEEVRQAHVYLRT